MAAVAWSEEDMRVFGPYPVGDGRQFYGDPLAIYRKLVVATDGAPQALIDAALPPPPPEGEAAPPLTPEERVAGEAAAERLAAVVREAFDLAPYDPETGKGTTDGAAFGILLSFLRFLAEQKRHEAAAKAPPVPA